MASDYSQGKIYKLTAGDLTYYGSTTITLNKRFTQHEQDAKNNNNRASQKLFETGEKVIIELIEDYPCKSKRELLLREGYYHLNFECVNKNIAGRSQKEYRHDNKEAIANKKKLYNENHKDDKAEYDKQYRENNKDTIKAKRGEKIKCECGVMVTKWNIGRHRNSQKHKKYIDSL